MDGAPDAAMMAPVEKIARFIASGDEACLSAFAGDDVVILENFAPHLFTGADAVVLWAKQMREHTATLSGLAHTFGPAQDFLSSAVCVANAAIRGQHEHAIDEPIQGALPQHRMRLARREAGAQASIVN